MGNFSGGRGAITEFLHCKCLFLKRRWLILYCLVEILQREGGERSEKEREERERVE